MEMWGLCKRNWGVCVRFPRSSHLRDPLKEGMEETLVNAVVFPDLTSTMLWDYPRGFPNSLKYNLKSLGRHIKEFEKQDTYLVLRKKFLN